MIIQKIIQLINIFDYRGLINIWKAVIIGVSDDRLVLTIRMKKLRHAWAQASDKATKDQHKWPHHLGISICVRIIGGQTQVTASSE
ncbi:MAG TPA: hypothetical protein VHT96_16510 [Clostridia bacterium]|nr:hypothetical protein [Clostridia bacterium]